MTTDNIMRAIILAGIVILLFIIAGNPVFAAEQLTIQTEAPWWDKYRFEIIVSFGCYIVGYIAAQHYKTRTGHQKAVNIATVNGAISGILAAWIFSNEYPINQAFQWAVMVGGSSPAGVWLLFQIVDRVFPGKGEVLKKGLFIPDEPEENKTVFNKAVALAAVALVGKRKDARKSRESTEVWTPEQREAEKTRILSEQERREITGAR